MEPGSNPSYPSPSMVASVTVFDNSQVLGRVLAAEILERIRVAGGQGLPYLLGCPGGRSLRSTYQALAQLVGKTRQDLSRLVIVMMDEYLHRFADGRFENCPADAPYGCVSFARREIRGQLNDELPQEYWLPLENIWVPDPADPAAYDARIESAGGIDLFLLASGASDGHVAFNPPGVALDSGAHIQELAEETRRDNLETFPEFGSLEAVPSHGVTIGLGTICRYSKEAVLVIHGSHKKATARRVWAAKEFDPAWPATIIHACKNGRVFLDRAAAGA
ncbi:MAG: 6-phosphogluconolactonase [Dongiaceae bacterium]